ncbi:similar to Saccharomyces cerevisiae YFR038W IRC5 Putative ATPase containing the DEAD/H helicase-related sequence motif [Maudiozyma saulgeensis]|uniref:Similar to Saccharomyces cerevisiae YFR038W IRC5 Putative ATPase containing the DEAD/H helicase-related sequence motif n=1 Tax=Maudiozyma saulgeensis TaxID=1789683 RepID=A0A1X7R391_9SACH|nr:similar to Saccharomyces cerevisiae YFR038W IRC5 Putative ATPase containing the DEAD/H helicase-related sequence motif [Kazachstania saulgeensis]
MSSIGSRLARTTRTKNVLNYKEKEEYDLKPDIIPSDDEDESLTTVIQENSVAPIWLQDDIKESSDVELDSDNDEQNNDDEQINTLIDGNHEEDNKEVESLKDLDEEDSRIVREKLKKLDEFVNQSKVYSGIIADTLLKRSTELVEEKEEEKNEKKQKQRKDDKESDLPVTKKQKQNKKKRSIVDFFKPVKKTEDKPKIDEQNEKSSNPESSEADVDAGIKEEQPSLLENCILKPYQMEGLSWLITLYENGLNGILADEMGLGKTLQSIALLAFVYEMDTKGPFLIAAPLSTVDNWMNEFEKFAPSLPVLKYYHQAGFQERSKLLSKFFKKTKGTGIVVTSYEIIMRDADYIMSQEWKFLIVDEGHRLKNINSKLIRELKRINTNNRLLLTGTPLQNNLAELWSLLNFIMPDIFSDFEMFNKWFDFKNLDLQSNSQSLNKVINDELEKNLITNLHTILKPFLLRRLKKNVLVGLLPPKREYIVNCPMTPIQKKFYTKALNSKLKLTIFKELVKEFFTINQEYIGRVSNKSIREYIDYKLNTENGNKIEDNEYPNNIIKDMDKLYKEHLHGELINKRLQNMMMQLRQIVDSTYLFYFPYLHPEELTLDDLLKTSGKLQTLQKLVIPLIKKGHKILIFSQLVKMLDLLEDWCDLNSLKCLRIDGSVDNETRKEGIKQFNTEGDDHQVYLLSTRAAGLGINLTAADTVVLFDSDWNPQVDLQAMDRCHRIGQDKPVIIYRFCCDNTIEHVILTRASNKRKLERMVIQMGRFNTLKKLAFNEGSFLNQHTGANRSTNKELVKELSLLLMAGESSIGFTKGSEDDGQILSVAEIKELTDRSDAAYKENRVVDLPHARLFETVSGF